VSILAKIKAAKKVENKKLFAVVASKRLGGKTTAAGTLPGRTLLLQAAVLESGSESAQKLASNKGNELHVVNFMNVNELIQYAEELLKDEDFDNVYIDGVTAITEQLTSDPKIAAIIKKNVWDGYAAVGAGVTDVMLALKKLTYSEHTKKPKNVFVTCSLTTKNDANGNITDVELEAKGRVAVSQITKLGEAVITIVKVQTENGEVRSLLTKSQGHWPGRIDGILDDENPGLIEEADLSQVLALVNNK
jgi:hypothetical protein